MYVGVVELLRNLPLYGGGFVLLLIRDLESRRDVLTGQSAGWALVNATSRRIPTAMLTHALALVPLRALPLRFLCPLNRTYCCY